MGAGRRVGRWGGERERWCGCREKGREMGWRERGGVGAGRRVGRWGGERERWCGCREKVGRWGGEREREVVWVQGEG